MARHYEYVIQGRPLSTNAGSVTATATETGSPRKTLSTRKEHRPTSNLRNLYRNSASSTEHFEPVDVFKEHRISSPTTPKLPPTPPAAEEEQDEVLQEQDVVDATTVAKSRSVPVTPVNGNNPPTPEDTPPGYRLKLPSRPFLALRPSIASTRAESFRTAHEHIYPEDELDVPTLEPPSSLLGMSYPELPQVDAEPYTEESEEAGEIAIDSDPVDGHEEHLSSTPTLPPVEEKRLSDTTATVDNLTPETQFMFNHTGDEAKRMSNMRSLKRKPVNQRGGIDGSNQHSSTIHEQVTVLVAEPPTRNKSLRDRLQDTKQLRPSASTEAFANVIGWNDGGFESNPVDAQSTKRLSAVSNPSAVEAYVIDSPIQPRKRGTLRKVVKNDSLRSTSSPVPYSNRTSLQSTSDSLHRLVHKKLKLNNQNRWSTGSEVSKRTLSWTSSPQWPKHEVIKVAVIPERDSSLQTSPNSSRRHSRSISATTGANMPPVSTPMPRRKRAISDSQESAILGQPLTSVRRSSLSAPTSRSGSRANSVHSQQLSMQREQAERDLRSTLERMESERLSASLRRSSQQSLSPTPATRQGKMSDLSTGEEPDRVRSQTNSAAGFNGPQQQPVTIELNGITPGSKEWADLRPSTLTGTPFSQTSMLSTSPEIIEAKMISFFPHNTGSVQLIEPNRLSETPAVKALKGQDLRRSRTGPEPKVSITTPRTSDLLATHDVEVDSPLRNPRRPPEPPHVLQLSVIPSAPKSELNNELGATPDTSPVKARTGTVLHKRPSLQGRDHSESFIKSLSRGMSLRNARNPKAKQDLDSTLHPMWRPKAFWDDADYRLRMQQDREKEHDGETTGDRSVVVHRSVTILEPDQRLARSNTITTGPMSLVRRISERRRQRKMTDSYLAEQSALVKQTSYSSLQKIRAGHKLYSMPPLRGLSLNVGIERLGSLRERVSNARAKREDQKRELRRDKLRKSIGPEVVSQSDSRFPNSGTNPGMDIEHLGGRRLDNSVGINQMLENARAEGLVGRRGLRM